MATESVVGVLQAGSPDRLLSAFQFTNTSAQTVHAEAGVIADDTTYANRARVLTAPPSSGDGGLVVRPVGFPAAAALADGTSNPTLSQVQAFPSAWNGVTWDRFTGRPVGDVFYGACLPSGGVSSGTAASTTVSLGYLWHPSSVTTLRYLLRLMRIAWTQGQQDDTAPVYLRLVRITAENGTPGGTAQTIQGHNNGSAASGATFRTAASGAPTRGTVISAQPISINQPGFFDFGPEFASVEDGGYAAQKSTAEGWEVQVVTSGTAPIVAATFGISAFWSETGR